MSTPSSLAGTAARGSATTVGLQIVRMVLQMTATVVLARLLSVHDFGLVAMVTAVIGVAELVRDFGLSLASIRAKNVTPGERTNLFWANTALGATCATLAAAATPLIAGLYGEPTLYRLVPPLASVFVLSGLTTQFRAHMLRDLRFGTVALSDTSGPAAGIATAITLAALGAGYWALVAQQIVAATVTFAVTAFNAHWWPGLPRRDVSIRRFFRFGAGVFGSQVLSYATQNSDNISIGAVWGPSVLGYYSRAFQLVMVPIMQINAPLTNVVLPVLARVHEDVDQLGRALKKSSMVACYFTAPALAGVAAMSGPLVTVLLGKAWASVAPMLAILAVAGVFRSIAQVGYWGLLATGRSGAMFRLQLWVQPLSIAMILAGLPWAGIGVSFGVLAGTILLWIVQLMVLQRVTGVVVKPLFGTALRSVGLFSAPAAAIAYLATRVVAGSALVSLAVGIGTALAMGALIGFAVPSVRRDLLTAYDIARLVVVRPKSAAPSAPSSPEPGAAQMPAAVSAASYDDDDTRPTPVVVAHHADDAPKARGRHARQ